MAFNLVKNCTKIGVTGGTVYWSVQQGVWGTSEEGSQAMKRLSDAILPAQEPMKKAVVDNLDGSVVLTAWNNGTKAVFQSLIEAPETVESYATHASQAVSKFVDENIMPK